jgi:hypothetical protein
MDDVLTPTYPSNHSFRIASGTFYGEMISSVHAVQGCLLMNCVGVCWDSVGFCWAIVGTLMAYVGILLDSVGILLDSVGLFLGCCWDLVGNNKVNVLQFLVTRSKKLPGSRYFDGNPQRNIDRFVSSIDAAAVHIFQLEKSQIMSEAEKEDPNYTLAAHEVKTLLQDLEAEDAPIKDIDFEQITDESPRVYGEAG